MRVYKIHNKLWRVANNGKVKDVIISNGEIVQHWNPYCWLTPTETMNVEMAIF